ncbi:putative metal-dependent hydrolase [Flavobacteriaceae bacterium UJ101]|nr:putative metal-dependent hydrolase [Flavobacteriaceae bacterium UJ101]
MSTSPLEQKQFPIGKFEKPHSISSTQIQQWIIIIKTFPKTLRKLVDPLSKDDLKLTYRLNGWNIQQLVHHCADSHMNSFIRFKLGLTEDSPTIKPYFEDRWATLPDTLQVDISESLKILEGLHIRWTTLLESLSSKDLKRVFIHPEHGQSISLAENIGLYAWHCNHHLAHIEQALQYQNNNEK